MPNTILKRWNPALNGGLGAFEELYPKTSVGQIAASGTPSATTFLRGDGQWAVPAGVDGYLNTTGDTSTGMQIFSTSLTNNDDWQNSPVSIRERGLAGAGDGEDRDAPNLNFHWSARLSKSLWFGADGRLNWGEYSGAGVPDADGIFRTGSFQSTVATGTAPLTVTSTTTVGNLNSDLLDGQHASYFIDTSGSTQTKSGSLTVTGNISAGRYYQSANGIPTGNLGSPTVTEMALFDEQFYNQTAFYDITKLKFYTSTDNVTWTEVTTISDTNKRALVGGDAGSGITIPNLTPYYRIEITNQGSYVFLNALYMYVTTSSHSMSIKIKARRRSDLTFVNITSSNNTVNLWPGHVYMPFTGIPFLTGGSSSGHYDIVHIDFQPTWSGDPTYGSFPINLTKLQIWGGYPAGKRNVYSTDENRNVAFPAALTATRLISNVATGTAPLTVSSTTAVTNLNADLLDGNHSSAFATAVHTHDVLSERGTITYGLSGLQWNDTSGVGGTGLNGAAPNNPTNEWWHHLIMNHGNASGYYVDIAAAFHTDDLYLRRNVSGTLSTWRKIWNEGNDGTGSGLDADLLDGNHASAFLLTTARNAANGVAPLDATSKVPLANLPDFITGAGRGFYLVGTISGAVSLSAATTGLVAQLVALSGGDYENMYGYMWTAAAEVTLTWTDQTTLGPVYQYHVLTPGDEGDSTSPVTLEAGDMIVFTKYSDTAGDNNDQEFTFSVINSSDPRFANYVPLTGGTLTGNLTISNTLPKLFLTDTDNNSDYSIWNNNGVFSIRDETNSSMRLIINSSGNIGIGTTSPDSRLHIVSAGNPTITLSGTDAGYTSILDLRSAGGGTSLINANGGANILRLQTNSVDRVWINDVGNVGIATTTPSEKLEVSGNAKATRLISTQATGTAPFTVASTTAVTNLNADLLDGNHAAAFALASHTHAIADVTSLQTSLDAKAPLASPTLTGTPAAPTAAAGTNTTQIATTAFITSALNLILPYGNIEKRKDTGLINIPYTISGSDFFVTDPISDGLKQMIINENIKIQLWMYKMALRKASMKGPYDANGNVTGRQTVRKFTHAEDLTGTPSLLTGHTRPAKLGDGVKMLSLQSDNASGTSLFKGTQNSDINATDVTFVTNNNDHYKGYVKTEVVVTAAMIQADNRIKIPMYDIATSWLINNTFIGIASPQGYYTIYCKKQTPGANGAIYQTISFNATNLPTVAANRNAFLAVRGVGMGGMNAQQVGPYAQGGGVFNGQYTPNKTLTMNLSGTIPGIIPFVTSRALQFRLVASTNGTSFIYGPPTSARGVFRCLGDGTAQSGMVLRLDFVNDTRKNLVPSYFMSNLANLL